MLAVKTARDHARADARRDGPRHGPAVHAHAAFHKAAAYLGARAGGGAGGPRHLPGRRRGVAAAVTDRTVLVVASAPSYAHGVVDPVERDRLRRRRPRGAVPRGRLHRRLAAAVPAAAGREAPPFELSVRGVTSLSVDLHKYGYAAKGASVVLYRDAQLRRHQYFAHAGWPGYPVVNPTVQGTKSAGLLARRGR